MHQTRPPRLDPQPLALQRRAKEKAVVAVEGGAEVVEVAASKIPIHECGRNQRLIVGPEPAPRQPPALCHAIASAASIARADRRVIGNRQRKACTSRPRANESSTRSGPRPAAARRADRPRARRGEKGKQLRRLATVKATSVSISQKCGVVRVTTAGQIVAIVATPPGEIRRTKQSQLAAGGARRGDDVGSNPIAAPLRASAMSVTGQLLARSSCCAIASA